MVRHALNQCINGIWHQCPCARLFVVEVSVNIEKQTILCFSVLFRETSDYFSSKNMKKWGEEASNKLEDNQWEKHKQIRCKRFVQKIRNSIFVCKINWFSFKVVSNHKVTTVKFWFVSKHSSNSKTSSDHIKLDQTKWPEPNHIYDCYVSRAIKNVLNTKTVVGFF